MTNDPIRLRDDPELTEEERRLLQADSAVTPPSALGAEIWAGLAAKLPAAGAPPGAAPAAQGGVSAGVGALLLKAALAVVAIGALALGARALLRSGPPLPTAPALPSRLPLAGSAELPASLAPAPVVSAATPGPLVPPAPSAPHANRLAVPRAAVSPSSTAASASEESRVVTAARAALRNGQSANALALLAAAQQRFGAGVLGQEREALYVEALVKSRQGAAARARGQAFLRNYENSPYAGRIRALIGSN